MGPNETVHFSVVRGPVWSPKTWLVLHLVAAEVTICFVEFLKWQIGEEGILEDELLLTGVAGAATRAHPVGNIVTHLRQKINIG